ncbi:tripartite motif-containing protein 2-like [Ptychodera flava]|uniref:tripartite motif-containing protein 2-like n=1 Tax=Ptychodera flava TaxID=63121 RepID=UPI00396A7E77
MAANSFEYPTMHFQVMEKFGSKRLKSPHGVALSLNGDIIVADRGSKRVQFFTWSCRYMTKLDVAEDPIDIAPITRERYAITDHGNAVVYIVTQNGKIIRTIGEGILKAPIGVVAFGEKNAVSIYVVDSEDGCIHVFNLLGKQVKVIGCYGNEDGQLQRPSYIALNSKQELVVSDSGNNRVQIFTSEGDFVRCFGASDDDNENSEGFSDLRGVAVDVHDNIFTACSGGVLMYSPSGKFICRVDSDDDEVGTPVGVAVTQRVPCEVVVSDSDCNLIRIYDREQ